MNHSDHPAGERLPRLKPAPIPAIHPLPEYLATGERKAIYDDTKSVLQVPWMGVVCMAFAHYPNFYGTLWQSLRPLYASTPFVEACHRLREVAEAAIEPLQPPPLADRLAAVGYAPREIEQIADMLEIFSHGNMAYLLIATQARLLLEGHALGDEAPVAAFDGRHAPPASVPFLLVEAHHAGQELRDLYDDIKATLGLPFVNTDYRALARWQSYLALAWGDLRGHIGGEPYARITDQIHRAAVDLALGLPNPAGLTPEVLRESAAADAPVDELIEVVRLFQWLLPGLIANVAHFRAQLTSN